MGCWHVLCYVTLATRYLCCPFVKFPKVHWSRQQGIELPILSLNPDGVTTACSAGYTNDLATIFLRWILPFPSISPPLSPFPSVLPLFLSPRATTLAPLLSPFLLVLFFSSRLSNHVLFLPPLLSTSIVIRRASGSADSAERINPSLSMIPRKEEPLLRPSELCN